MKKVLYSAISYISIIILFTSCFNLPTKKQEDKNISRWVAVGNSITWHPINSNWDGEYGMAATKKENDYVHILDSKFKKINPASSFEIAWAVDWESNHKDYDLSYFNQFFHGDETLVVIRLGENVTSIEDYESDFRLLVQHIKTLSPKAKIIISGIFMSSSIHLSEKEKIQKNIAELEGCTWVNINHLDTNRNKSKVGTQVMGDDGNLHVISNQTVADHPSDEGMIAIANAIYDAI